VGKDSGKTNHIERFNNTIRQRVSRLVRSTLSFSNKLKNHTGAIWNFVHHYSSRHFLKKCDLLAKTCCKNPEKTDLLSTAKIFDDY
jgi:hypothetical protein